MKIYKLTLSQDKTDKYGVVATGMELSRPKTILVEHFLSLEKAKAKKSETLDGLARLLGAGAHGQYSIEIQEIEVQE